MQLQFIKATGMKVFASPFQQENILLSQRGPGNIKVVDFGSSCYEQQRGKSIELNLDNM